MTVPETPLPLRVAVAGLGAVGMAVAKALNAGIPGFILGAVSARNLEAARTRFAAPDVAVVPIAALADYADMVIECAPAALLPQIVTPFLEAGKTALVLSCGALLERGDLIALAASRGGRIIVPSGAMLGLDALRAAAEGNIDSVTLTSRKPVEGFLGAPYLARHAIDLAGIIAPLRIFAGSAREAAREFPANVNVAAALALAGIGPDRTRVEIWADPTIARNTHSVDVIADCARFSLTIENVPSENPKTSRITALSAIAALRRMTSPLQVGS